MRITLFRRSLFVGLGMLAIASGTGLRATTYRVEISNLHLNLQGLVVADVVLKSPPMPTLNNVRGKAQVQFKVGASSETVDVSGLAAVNVKRTAVSTAPFPCNQTLDVVATVTAPDDVKGHSTTARLSRTCTRAEGTPDLVVLSIKRTDGAVKSDADYLKSPRETPIRVTVVVKNIAPFNMPYNEQGGTPWIAQVTPGTPSQGPNAGTQTFRFGMQAGQEYSFDVMPVALPCGKLSDVTVVVDRDNVILESNEKNNTLVAKIPGNRCQDSDL